MINDDDDVLGLTQQLFEMLSIHANIYFLSIYANIYSFEHLCQYTDIFFLIDNDNSTLSLIGAD